MITANFQCRPITWEKIPRSRVLNYSSSPPGDASSIRLAGREFRPNTWSWVNHASHLGSERKSPITPRVTASTIQDGRLNSPDFHRAQAAHHQAMRTAGLDQTHHAVGRFASYDYVLILIAAYLGDRAGGTPTSVDGIIVRPRAQVRPVRPPMSDPRAAPLEVRLVR